MKRLILCLGVLGLLFGFAVPVQGGVVQWRVEDGGNGHYYELVGNILNYPNDVWSWQDAKVMAEASSYLGVPGHLATITSGAETQFILDTFFVIQRGLRGTGMRSVPS